MGETTVPFEEAVAKACRQVYGNRRLTDAEMATARHFVNAGVEYADAARRIGRASTSGILDHASGHGAGDIIHRRGQF